MRQTALKNRQKKAWEKKIDKQEEEKARDEKIAKHVLKKNHVDDRTEKEILDELLKIAYSNNLSLDWVFFRALKRFVDEYKETGNL